LRLGTYRASKPGDRKVGGLRHFCLALEVDAEHPQLDDRRSAPGSCRARTEA
jgi:hypothetical protein